MTPCLGPEKDKGKVRRGETAKEPKGTKGA